MAPLSSLLAILAVIVAAGTGTILVPLIIWVIAVINQVLYFWATSSDQNGDAV